MDPSEFEGTVERQEDALSAGALELLLSAPVEPTFAPIDLTKEISDICLAMFSLKDAITHLSNEASLNSLCLVMDEQAIKIAEMKETYVTRRKALTGKVKKFYTEIGDDTSNSTVNSCKELIDTFKVEFDGLAALSRFAETSFVSMYKSLRDLPDPVSVLNETLLVCQRTHEALKKSQEQMQLANTALNTSHHGVTSSSHGPSGGVALFSNASTTKLQSELDALYAQVEVDKEELKQSYLTELVNVRSKYETDARNREQQLQSAFEKQQMDLQKHCDSVVAKLEVEISSLLRTLNEHKHSSLESEERLKMLDAEMTKRRELEEKLRTTYSSLSAAEDQNAALKGQIEALTAAALIADEKTNAELRQLRDKIESLTLELADSKSKLSHASTELASRPPVSFNDLMDKIGMVTESDLSNAKSKDSKNVTWYDIESYVVESVRRSNSEATASRIKEQESAKQLARLENRVAALLKQIDEQAALTASLEKDLMSAHSLALQKNKGTSGKGNRADTASREGSSSNQDEANDALASVLHGSSGGGGATTSGTDKVMLAVQSQRDRYMKACRDKEAELNSVKLTLDRVQQEAEQLQKENLELYRRLRLLRVSSSGQSSGAKRSNGGSSGGSSSSTGRRTRNRYYAAGDGSDDDEGGGGDGGGSGDMDEESGSNLLDEKYMSLYEAEISPFKMEEMDKQSMLTKLNVFERMLVYMNKNVIQDKWSRHAFIVYLILVHVFALLYAFSVLNPQLIEEVDQHMKNKWSMETFDLQDKPDLT